MTFCSSYLLSLGNLELHAVVHEDHDSNTGLLLISTGQVRRAFCLAISQITFNVGHIIFDNCKSEPTTSLRKSTICSTNRITPCRVRLLRGSGELIWRGGRERERRSARCARPRPPDALTDRLTLTSRRAHRAHGKSSSLSRKDD